MFKPALRIGVLGFVFSVMVSPVISAGSFVTASKPACSEVVITVKGRINYKDNMKSGEFGFHHCLHKKLYSESFPKVNPNNNACLQLDESPEVVSINPPLPHEGNAVLPVFHRPNPYFIPDGTACEVKYAQYYLLH